MRIKHHGFPPPPDRIQGCRIAWSSADPTRRESSALEQPTCHPQPSPLQRSPAQPSERDAGGGEPQGRAACGGGLTAILDLRPRRRLASIMVGTEGWFL